MQFPKFSVGTIFIRIDIRRHDDEWSPALHDCFLESRCRCSLKAFLFVFYEWLKTKLRRLNPVQKRTPHLRLSNCVLIILCSCCRTTRLRLRDSPPNKNKEVKAKPDLPISSKWRRKKLVKKTSSLTAAAPTCEYCQQGINYVRPPVLQKVCKIHYHKLFLGTNYAL